MRAGDDRRADSDQVIWGRQTGGSGHYSLPEWDERDRKRADAYDAAAHEKARTFLDLPIECPTRLGMNPAADEVGAHSGSLPVHLGGHLRPTGDSHVGDAYHPQP